MRLDAAEQVSPRSAAYPGEMTDMAPNPRAVATKSRRRIAPLLAVALFTPAWTIYTRVAADVPWEAVVEGVAFAVGGLLAWWRRPDNRTGKLMVLYGLTVWGYHLPNTGSSIGATLAVPLSLTSFCVLWFTILVYPKGRVTTRAERVVAGIIVFFAIWQFTEMMLFNPAPPCEDCARNFLNVANYPWVLNLLKYTNPWIVTVFVFGTAWIVGRRWLRSTPAARRVFGPMLLVSLVLLLANRIGGITEIVLVYLNKIDRPMTIQGVMVVLRWVEQIAITLLAFTFLSGLVRSRLQHARVSRLVVELGELPSPEMLEQALRGGLGDPTLTIGVWRDEEQRYVRANGDELRVPEEGSHRIATPLAREGKPLALMVHDEALLDEPGLVEATAAASRLAVENERLQAEIRAQLEEVHASRQRIVSAADDERRRIERDLHDGAQQRLLRTSMALQVAESAVAPDADPAVRTSLQVAAEELQAALAELRELARGIHPAVLTQRGLGAALHSLSERATVPVEIASIPADRLPETVETAGYFVVSEALANVAKHARATRVVVHARVIDGTLEIEVTDDGIGGAAVDAGTGLRGLSDRVSALDGLLTVESNTGGTTLRARIPFEPARVAYE
jgi:signal transduction histidine kinase